MPPERIPLCESWTDILGVGFALPQSIGWSVGRLVFDQRFVVFLLSIRTFIAEIASVSTLCDF